MVQRSTRSGNKSQGQGRSKTKPTASAAAGKSVDNREDLRIPVQLLVDYRSDGNYLFDFCKDLGAGGVFIQTEKPLAHGSEIELTFTIPDSKETLHTKGKVIWVQNAIEGRTDLCPGMGVQFTAFESESRKILKDFIDRYALRTAS
jgi:type IV pilus assembly protein PilZ